MNKKTERKIYNKVAMRYRRKAKAMGKPKEWKNILILGLTFEQALDEAIKNYDPEREKMSVEEAIEEFKKGIMGDENEKPLPKREEGTEYVINPSTLRLWNRESEEEHAEKMKALERQVNAELEANRIPVCPRCKCNPCICRD